MTHVIKSVVLWRFFFVILIEVGVLNVIFGLATGDLSTREIDETEEICSRFPRLPLVDREKCLNSPGTAAAISSGTRLGLSECRHQFKYQRWNCTLDSLRNRDPIFSSVTNRGNSEAAYVSAITSAAVTYAIAKACARGNITTCGCAPPTTIATNNANSELTETTWDSVSSVSSSTTKSARYWRWGGCSADVEFAVKLSRKYLDSIEADHRDAKTAMNLHNNKAGRKTVQIMLDTECKCHGVSGSCTLKTCWLKLPPFRKIGERLMIKYKKSRLVQAVSRNHSSVVNISHKWKNRSDDKKKHNKTILPILILPATRNSRIRLPRRTELVYLEGSPNYCEPDGSTGSLGTHSRRCIKTNSSFELGPNLHQGGCDILCCGRGYNTHQVWRRWKCHCKFKWCCVVECQDCQERVEVYTCN